MRQHDIAVRAKDDVRRGNQTVRHGVGAAVEPADGAGDRGGEIEDRAIDEHQRPGLERIEQIEQAHTVAGSADHRQPVRVAGDLVNDADDAAFTGDAARGAARTPWRGWHAPRLASRAADQLDNFNRAPPRVVARRLVPTPTSVSRPRSRTVEAIGEARVQPAHRRRPGRNIGNVAPSAAPRDADRRPGLQISDPNPSPVD